MQVCTHLTLPGLAWTSAVLHRIAVGAAGPCSSSVLPPRVLQASLLSGAGLCFPLLSGGSSSILEGPRRGPVGSCAWESLAREQAAVGGSPGCSRGPGRLCWSVLRGEAVCGARTVVAAPGPLPLCEGFGFSLCREPFAHLWAAFPGGGKALEISIAGGGGGNAFQQ